MKNPLLHTFFYLSLMLLLLACNRNSAGKRSEVEAVSAENLEYTVMDGEKKVVMICRLLRDGSLQIPLEDFASLLNMECQPCSRCGNTSLYLKNGDVPIVEWNSPYVDFGNKEGRLTLDSFSVFEKGKTYVDIRLFSILDLCKYTIQEKAITIR